MPNVDTSVDPNDKEEILTSIEDLYGEIDNVEFGEDNITVVFKSGEKMNFAYPDAIIPYIGDNGNWWINGEDTGCPSKGEDGADGEDGQDGANGENGQDGADGEDGVNGQDGADGQDGANGQDGADGQDGKDGVGISNVTYNDGKMTITFTDGTSKSFSLGTSSDGSLVGVVDCLNDNNPMLISSLHSGDMKIMEFGYDNENRIISAQYNTIENNEAVPFYVMNRNYTSDYTYTTTISEIATYDGQTENYYDGYYDSYQPYIDIWELTENYTIDELINLITPNGFEIEAEAYDHSNGSTVEQDPIYHKLGETISGVDSETVANIDNYIRETFLNNINGEPIYTLSNDKINIYYIVEAYNFYEIRVYHESYPANFEYEHCDSDWLQDEENGWCDYGLPKYYTITEHNSKQYASRIPVEYNIIILSDIRFNGGTIWTEIYEDGREEINMSADCQPAENGCKYMTIPAFGYRRFAEVEQVSSLSKLVELIETGDGYKAYEVKKRFGSNGSNFFGNGAVLNNVLFAKTNGTESYKVYEKGAMMDAATVYLTEQSNGSIVGSADEELANEEDQIIFEMDGDYIQKVTIRYRDEKYDYVYPDSGNTGGDSDNNTDTDYPTTKSSSEIEEHDVLEFVYNSDNTLADIIAIDETGERYDNLFEITYDDRSNPIKIQVNGGEVAAIGDDYIDEVMAIIGVAQERKILNIETGEIETSYSYKMNGTTELLNATYNYSYKNFFQNSFNALNIMPFGIEFNNAIEEVTWAGHSSYLFSEYSNFNEAGYPLDAKLSASINPFELDGYAGPTLSGISGNVSFEYVNKK